MAEILIDAKLIQYRKSNEQDLPDLLEFFNKFHVDVENIIPDQFLIAFDNDKIIGCVRIRKIGGYLKLASIIVLPECRKMGIGRNLVQKILNEANKPVYIICSHENEGFYRKIGFAPIKMDTIPEIFRYKCNFETENVLLYEKIGA